MSGPLWAFCLFIPMAASGQQSAVLQPAHVVESTGNLAPELVPARGLIPPELARTAASGIVPDGEPSFMAPALRTILGLNRGARTGAILGGVAVGVYGAVWYGRECEGGCTAPHLQGALIGGAVGAIGGALIGGLFDRIQASW